MKRIVAIVLVATTAGLSACSQRQSCYAPERQPEFGWQLRLVPCDDGGSEDAG